ncbi:hypothetical protein BHE74_00004382 [Ensete ventricosum]|nr:hypothetical protein BHE74_00004382 [Ensete ventricosum]
MAIFVALNSPEIEVIGLTTIYGNVYTTLATRNASREKFLVDVDWSMTQPSGHEIWELYDPVMDDYQQGTKLRIADFVHGSDGLGNQNFSPPKGKAIDKSAATFLVEKASQFPGEVTVVALGPLTNIALIFGDPDAADIVFTCGADILAVGINVTHQVVLTGT